MDFFESYRDATGSNQVDQEGREVAYQRREVGGLGWNEKVALRKGEIQLVV
jgi:hypothetical protein